MVTENLGPAPADADGRGRMMAVVVAMFFIIAGLFLLVLVLSTITLLSGAIRLAAFQVAPVTRPLVVIAVLAGILAGGAILLWLGLVLSRRVPYYVGVSTDSLTLLFPFRREQITHEYLISYRYLFVVGGRFGAGADLIVTRMKYRLPDDAQTASCFLLLAGDGPAPTFGSTRGFVTVLDKFYPGKRIIRCLCMWLGAF